MSEPFFFGVPLIARAAARDWPLVQRLFALMLRSVLAQTDPDFRLILAGHDAPEAWRDVAHDPRFEFVQADWLPEPPTGANDDGGAKKWLVKQRVRRSGGGLLMFLDADDWIGRGLVQAARAAIGPTEIGGIVTDGLALDYPSLRADPFPIAGAFDGALHGLCGSTTVARIEPGSADPARLDPHLALGSHHEWEERAARVGLSLARLPTRAVYVVGTGQNHSAAQGPFAAWRREVTQAVRREGVLLDATLAAEFGQDLRELLATGSRKSFPAPCDATER